MLKNKFSFIKPVRYIVLSALLALPALPATATSSTKIAMEEYEKALALAPNVENGGILYKKCAVCHDPEGWGRKNGHYPQIAGQLSSVIIKQLADIRAGNRGNPTMYPFTTGRVLESAQDIADVAAYVSQLPMTWDNGKGAESRAERGKSIYAEYCADCHGKQGEGDHKEHIPLIYGQHYDYLVRQFRWIRIGRRNNADDEMVEQIQNFHSGEMYDVLSYVSHLSPPEEKLARENWHNPDIPEYSRNREDQYRSTTQKLTTEQNNKDNKAFKHGAND